MSRIFQAAAALFLATAALAPTAAAHPAGQATSIEVSYADLNLSARAGAETLLRRMKGAAAEVCGERPSPRQIKAMIRHAACTSGAMESAVAALNVPMVTALFNRRAAGTEVAAQ
jgi:UrcA family protein